MNDLILTASLPPAIAAQVSSWVQHGGRESLSRNTLRAYQADLAVFRAWCERQGTAFLPALPETVAAFVAAEFAGGWRVDPATGQADPARAPTTIRRRVAAVTWLHSEVASLPDPAAAKPVTLALRALGRQAKEQRIKPHQADGLTADVVAPVARRTAVRIEAGRARPRDVRDLALMLVGRDLLGRASELASLDREAICFDPDGTATVALMRGKTDDTDRTYPLGQEAAEALLRWLALAGIESGPVFVGVTRGGKVRRGRRIGVRDVSRAVQSLAGDTYSAHSMRVGMAQDLAADNHELPAIMQAGGWNTPQMVSRYTERQTAKKSAVAQYHSKRKFR